MISVSEILKALIPPQDSDPKVTIFRWLMWAAVVTLCIMVSWLVTNTAPAVELKDVRDEIATIKKENLEGQIFQKSIDVCMTEAGPLRQAYQQELSRLTNQWRQVVRDQRASPATLKSCNELGLTQQ